VDNSACTGGYPRTFGRGGHGQLVAPPHGFLRVRPRSLRRTNRVVLPLVLFPVVDRPPGCGLSNKGRPLRPCGQGERRVPRRACATKGRKGASEREIQPSRPAHTRSVLCFCTAR
jgi:hypothetical protein